MYRGLGARGLGARGSGLGGSGLGASEYCFFRTVSRRLLVLLRFSVLRSPFSVLRSTFYVLACVRRASFDVLQDNVDLVRVNALVTEKGRPIAGLTAQDFEVLDNGVPQRVQVDALQDVPIDVVLVVDAGGSIGGDAARLERAAQSVIADLRAQDRVAAVRFTHRVEVLARLTRDRALVRSDFRMFPAPGAYTSAIDALLLGLSHRRPPRPAHLVARRVGRSRHGELAGCRHAARWWRDPRRPFRSSGPHAAWTSRCAPCSAGRVSGPEASCSTPGGPTRSNRAEADAGALPDALRVVLHAPRHRCRLA